MQSLRDRINGKILSFSRRSANENISKMIKIITPIGVAVAGTATLRSLKNVG